MLIGVSNENSPTWDSDLEISIGHSELCGGQSPPPLAKGEIPPTMLVQIALEILGITPFNQTFLGMQKVRFGGLTPPPLTKGAF